MVESGFRLSRFELQLCNLLSVRPGGKRHCLHFSLCENGVVLVPALEICCRIKCVNKYKVLVRGPGIE